MSCAHPSPANAEGEDSECRSQLDIVGLPCRMRCQFIIERAGAFVILRGDPANDRPAPRAPSASKAWISAAARLQPRASCATKRSSRKPPVEAARGRAKGRKCASPTAMPFCTAISRSPRAADPLATPTPSRASALFGSRRRGRVAGIEIIPCGLVAAFQGRMSIIGLSLNPVLLTRRGRSAGIFRALWKCEMRKGVSKELKYPPEAGYIMSKVCGSGPMRPDALSIASIKA